MNEQMEARFAKYFNEANEQFEKGFLSEAARKRALESVGRAYDVIVRAVQDEQLKVLHAFPVDENYQRIENDEEKRISALYYGVPALHVLKEKHFDMYKEWADFAIAKDLVALRKAIKEAEVAKIEIDENKVKIEAVRKSIIDEMEMRKEQYVHGLELAKHFGHLPVSINAHWVHGHKGTQFIRHFFYMAGKLTPLNMIIAIMEEDQRRKDAAI